MNINRKLIEGYLSNDFNRCKIEEHWIFSYIEEDQYLFDEPKEEKREEIEKIDLLIKEALLDFEPFNVDIFNKLFPNWEKETEKTNVLLAVGCPQPYDAFVRNYQGKEYMIFDLIRLSDYNLSENDMKMVIRQLITHELVHICIHNRYKTPDKTDYIDYLQYITFDEGFAHLLAFNDNVRAVDFTKIIEEHLEKNLKLLQDALREKDKEKQTILLEAANTGYYWDKFAAISGKLLIAEHIEDINHIYNSGVQGVIRLIKQI